MRLGAMKMEGSGNRSDTLSIQVLMENMEQRQWDFPDIKAIPHRRMRGNPFSCDVVYTNVQAAGAYRGYGATQGIFAWSLPSMNWLKSLRSIGGASDEKYCPGGHVHAGILETANACALDRCITVQIIFTGKYPVRDMGMEKCALQVWQSPCRVLHL